MATDHSRDILSQIRTLPPDEQRELVAEILRDLSKPSDDASRPSLLELRGLGKEIWETVDVKEYLRNERDSWGG